MFSGISFLVFRNTMSEFGVGTGPLFLTNAPLFLGAIHIEQRVQR